MIALRLLLLPRGAGLFGLGALGLLGGTRLFALLALGTLRLAGLFGAVALGLLGGTRLLALLPLPPIAVALGILLRPLTLVRHPLEACALALIELGATLLLCLFAAGAFARRLVVTIREQPPSLLAHRREAALVTCPGRTLPVRRDRTGRGRRTKVRVLPIGEPARVRLATAGFRPPIVSGVAVVALAISNPSRLLRAGRRPDPTRLDLSLIHI